MRMKKYAEKAVKKNILIFRSNGVDPDSRVEKEANSLKKAGYQVTIFAWDRSSNHKLLSSIKKLEDTEVERISFGGKALFGAGKKSLLSYIGFQISIALFIVKKRKSYDIGHFCDFDTAFTGSIISKILGKKYVFDMFDTVISDPKSIFDKVIHQLENRIINNADVTIICSEMRRRQICESNPRKLEIIHNTPTDALDVLCEREDFDFCQNKVKLSYIGVLQKNRLIEALLTVISNNKNYELHIAGFGELENIVKQFANKYENIIYYGKVEYKKTLEIEKFCDIIPALYDPIITNHRYAAPNKFYEALMLGKPLIMVKGSGMSEYVEKYDIGEVIPPTLEGLAQGIERLVQKKTKWDNMRRRERKIYNNHFSWDIMESRLLKIYEVI